MYEEEKYVFWEPSLLHVLSAVNGKGLTINLTNPEVKLYSSTYTSNAMVYLEISETWKYVLDALTSTMFTIKV